MSFDDRDRRDLALIVTVAFGVRVLLLALRGDYLVFDEGYYLLLARNLRDHQTFALNGLPHVALSPLQPLLVALFSLPGWSDLWTSRLLGALAGALVAVPVWLIAAASVDRAAARRAAILAVAAPALMSYLPFFPGRSWNLYFGSEPLFVVLAIGACAAAMRASRRASWRAFLLTGVLCAAAFLTRAEGVVLAPLVLLLLGLDALRAGPPARRGWLLAALVAALMSAPYLLYLRSALGRWAFSGRVQAVETAAAPAPSARTSAQRGGSVLDDFVWGGDQARFRAELYGLTPDGRRMQSQYWGVDTSEAGPSLPPSDTAVAGPPATAERRTFGGTLVRALGVVLPWWLWILALLGYALAWRRLWSLRWLLPPAASALVPVVVAYVEPRVLLPLVPVAAIGVALLLGALDAVLARQRPAAARAAGVAFAAVAAALLLPLGGRAVDALAGDTPLQQLASAQRLVGELIGANVPDSATVMSWHPAIAVYAERDWRVMPEATLERTLVYATRRADLLVLSRFHPTPLGNAPRPFTIVYLDRDSTPPAHPLTLEQIEITPLLFVGRMRRVAP